jgi:hypothetical protein
VNVIIALPKGWSMRSNTPYGVVIDAPHGSVTVDVGMRNFTLGERHVLRYGPYARRGWRDRLYRDAIKSLVKLGKEIEESKRTAASS